MQATNGSTRTTLFTIIGALALALPAVAAQPQTAPAGADAGIDRAILADPSRPDEEKAQDAARKALDVYEWLGIAPGMTVADLFASGGYNTFLMSRAVGQGGKVYSVFEFYADKEAFDGRLYKMGEVQYRVKQAHLDNVELVTRIADLPPDSVDVMLAVRNYHDVEWVFKDLKRKDVVAAIYRGLKPGGVVGIVEVATDQPGWDEKAHRLNEKVVVADFEAGGFELAGRSDMLANPADDHKASGFEEGRYNMDRYLLKFRKPVR